ncbi:MAG TPA: hypothetical protein VF735_16935 [Pyrinomonadaceae bacterium]|jgi:hypothetical protein
MGLTEEEDIIDSLLYDFSFKLVEEDDVITELIARSYSHTWGLDDYQNLEARFVDENKISFSVELYLSGETDDEAPSVFDTIRAELRGEAVQDDNTWEISTYEIIEADFGINYEEYDYAKAVLSNVNYFQTFSDEISRLKLLNNLVIEDEMTLKTLQRQIYIGAITCLETYLSDALVNKVLSSQAFLESFISKYDFGGRKLELNQLFDYVKKAEDIAKSEMLELMYHNLPKVSQIYQAAVGVEFPRFSTIAKAVSTRHDLVHRNGKTKEGKEVEISKEIVNTVITDVESFIGSINQRLERQLSPEVSEDDLEF